VNALALPLLALALAATPEREVLDRVAATVNGEVITLTELKDRAGEDYSAAARLPAGARRDKAVGDALRRAYDLVLAEKLFHAQAATLGVEITDQQVDAAVEDIKKRNGFDDQKLTQALAEAGLTREAFRAQVRRDLEGFQILSYKVRSKVKVSDQDVENYYKQHPQEFEGVEERHVRHIFIPLPEAAPAAAVEKAQGRAQAALQRLAAGEDFGAVAKAVSQGPGAEEGGDLGWMKRGTLQKKLEDVIFALPDGQVSKPVRAGPGLHLFKVEERRLGGGRDLEKVKDEIRDRLAMEQSQTYRGQYLAELKRDAVIEVNLPELRGE
jgi:peptidyl-prolyl cis-trans isomerase SurA